jgi:N utilization substance protein B
MKDIMDETFQNFSSSQGHISDALKTLRHSLEKAHELYFWLLLLPVELTNLREQQIDINRHKFITTEEDINPNLRFVENELIERLRQSALFNEYVEDKKISWMPNDRIIISNLLKLIMESDIYNEYMNAPSTDIHSDCEFWRNIYKHIIFNNPDFLETLEEKSVFWNDDLNIIGTFVLKTIKRFEDNPDQAIMSMFKDDEDAIFGDELFKATVKNKEEYRSYINEFVKKDSWDSERLAFMDVVIILTAIAEILNFPKIPIKVSVNEYYALVAPFMIDQSNPLYSVNDVFNGIFVHGNMLGDAMFYGSGAGKLPTASAVVGDVVDAAKHLHDTIPTDWSNEPLEILPVDEVSGKYFVRVKDATVESVEKVFGEVQIVELDALPDEFAFVTEAMKFGEYKAKVGGVDGEIVSMIRVKD